MAFIACELVKDGSQDIYPTSKSLIKSRVLTPFCLTKQIGKTIMLQTAVAWNRIRIPTRRIVEVANIFLLSWRRALFFELKLSLERATLHLCTLKNYPFDCDYKRL